MNTAKLYNLIELLPQNIITCLSQNLAHQLLLLPRQLTPKSAFTRGIHLSHHLFTLALPKQKKLNGSFDLIPSNHQILIISHSSTSLCCLKYTCSHSCSYFSLSSFVSYILNTKLGPTPSLKWALAWSNHPTTLQSPPSPQG